MKRLLIPLLLIMSVLMLTGCENSIFEKEENKYGLVEYTKNELKNDVYYIKNGTKFYEPYMPNATFNNGSKKVSSNRIVYFNKNIQNVPTCYSNEFIAVSSNQNSLEGIYLERFYDCGYTLGINGITYDEEGYLYFDSSKSCVKGTEAYKYFSELSSKNIRIETINGETVSPDMISEGGILTDLEKDKSYTIAYYAGTRYQTADIKADIRMMESYEMYQTESSKETKNGYSSISLPDYLLSGYYYLSGKGFFIYNAGSKGEEDLPDSMNEPYYQNKYQQNELYAQQYVIQFEKRTSGAVIQITYDENSVTSMDEVNATLEAPNGLEYTFITEIAGIMTCKIQEAVAGTWAVSILPKDIKINGISVSSEGSKQESIKNEYFFDFEKDMQNVLFRVDYDGEGEVVAMLVDEKGNTFSFTEEAGRNTSYLTYNALYLSSGSYTVYVYHFIDTNITNVDYSIDEGNMQQDVIIISE